MKKIKLSLLIAVGVLMLGIFSGCKEDEELLPPGSSSYYYNITVSNAAGDDLLNPDNQSNIINGLSLAINGKEAQIYTVEDDAIDGLCGFLKAFDDDCWALAVGPFQFMSKRDKKIELKINGKKYIIDIKARLEAMEGGGQLIWHDIYLNGELLEFMRAPVVIPITI